jgi:hypothetical protein
MSLPAFLAYLLEILKYLVEKQKKEMDSFESISG